MKKHYSHFHDRTGEEIKNNQGLKMKIIVYNGSDDILVKFEDGYKVKTQYGLFKRGNINNPNFRGANFKDRTGETNINFQNLNMEIIEYINNSNIKIKFEDGYICKTNYNCFKNGKVKSRYSPSVYGIGILGDEPTSDENGNLYNSYITWKNMICRCYSNYTVYKQNTYIDKYVCDEWLNYSNFKKWYDENYYQIDNDVMALDKDIIVKNNKVYSPSTAIFTPSRINNLFPKSDKSRGKYPIGVNKTRNNKYIAECSMLNNNGKRIRHKIGRFNTPEEAFNAYKQFKEKYIKQVADEYKDKIPKKLYEAMYNYKVEITD